jgi:exonuclease SbcC
MVLAVAWRCDTRRDRATSSTLSKEHRRQVIIAVHDRPLFDYLCLELSPAFAGDELITIELAKTGDNHSWVNSNRCAFEPETAVKPLAA